MFIIKAIAPTSYQLNSLRRFGLNVKSNGGGSHTGIETFDTEEEAKEFLTQRAEMYYDEYEGQVDEHIEGIEASGYLTIDAVTAKIIEVDEDGNEI